MRVQASRERWYASVPADEHQGFAADGLPEMADVRRAEERRAAKRRGGKAERDT